MVFPIKCTSLSNLDIRTECLDDLHLTKKYFAKSPTVEYNRVINFIRWSSELPGSNLLLANSDEILTACPRRMHILLSLSETLFLKYHRIRQSNYIIYVKIHALLEGVKYLIISVFGFLLYVPFDTLRRCNSTISIHCDLFTSADNTICRFH